MGLNRVVFFSQKSFQAIRKYLKEETRNKKQETRRRNKKQETRNKKNLC